jgi:hypothetical protein
LVSCGEDGPNDSNVVVVGACFASVVDVVVVVAMTSPLSVAADASIVVGDDAVVFVAVSDDIGTEVIFEVVSNAVGVGDFVVVDNVVVGVVVFVVAVGIGDFVVVDNVVVGVVVFVVVVDVVLDVVFVNAVVSVVAVATVTVNGVCPVAVVVVNVVVGAIVVNCVVVVVHPETAEFTHMFELHTSIVH